MALFEGYYWKLPSGLRNLPLAHWSHPLNNWANNSWESQNLQTIIKGLLFFWCSVVMSIKIDLKVREFDLCSYQLWFASCPQNVLQSTDWQAAQWVELHWLYYSQAGGAADGGDRQKHSSSVFVSREKRSPRETKVDHQDSDVRGETVGGSGWPRSSHNPGILMTFSARTWI